MNEAQRLGSSVAQSSQFSHQFLIAMPTMEDFYFKKAVVYVCEHNEQGALGLIINRPMPQPLQFIFEQMHIEVQIPEVKKHLLLFGGPLQQERGFVVHETSASDWRASVPMPQNLSVTTSHDILTAIARGEGPQEYLVILGYAGWEAQQLEYEIATNVWLLAPVCKEILFEVPCEQRWEAAAASMGIDINMLSSDVGHA